MFGSFLPLSPPPPIPSLPPPISFPLNGVSNTPGWVPSLWVPLVPCSNVNLGNYPFALQFLAYYSSFLLSFFPPFYQFLQSENQIFCALTSGTDLGSNDFLHKVKNFILCTDSLSISNLFCDSYKQHKEIMVNT
jgi:hypothetical protein